jgi:predicted DNA-binding protein
MKKSSTPPTRRSRFTSIRLTPQEREQLDELAALNERTLAGEVRIALRKHIEQERAAATNGAEAAA